MEFITIKVQCEEQPKEILIGELFSAGFDSFQEFDDGFEASCEAPEFSLEAVQEVFSLFPNIQFEIKEQEKSIGMKNGKRITIQLLSIIDVL